MGQSETPEGPDAPDKQALDQIRARRLARLGSALQASSPSDGPSAAVPSSPSLSSSTHQNSKAPAASPQPAASTSSPAPATMTSPTNQSTGESASKAAKLGEKEKAAVTATAMRPSQHRKLNPPQPEQSIEDWTSEIITTVFRVSIDPRQKTDSNGHPLTMLDELAVEVLQSGAPLRLDGSHVDQIIFEATKVYPRGRLGIEYLYPCWKRAFRAAEHAKVPAKKKLLDELRRLSHSNCLFACTMPDMFDRQDRDSLALLLLGEVDREDDPARNERALFEFVGEAIPKFEEDPDVYPVAFVDAMMTISERLASMTVMDDYKPYMNALHLYTRFKPLIAQLACHSSFIPKVDPNDIERMSIFGPFFRLSPLQPAAILRDFASPRDMDQNAIRIAQDSVRVQCSTHQKELLTIVSAFVRHSAETRNRALDWFAYILNTNQKRRAMRVDPREVASDGFMMNVTAVLDLLSEPFLDNTFAKVDRIDVNYFRRNPRIDISEETKLHADLAESKAFWETPATGENNFITEVFVLTLAAHHYGTEAINAHFKNMDRDIKWMEKQIGIMEGQRAGIRDPFQLQQLETMIRRHTAALDKTVATKHATQGVLLDPGMQGLSLRFMRYVAVWLLRVATKSDYKPSPEKTVVLPLSEPAPKEFACLPEYAILSLVDNFKFISRFMPQILVQAVGDELITLCITILHSSNYIKNPYLKSSLVTILYLGSLDFTNRKGVLVPQMIGMKFANDHMLHALMKFYIECESTGAHTQFYDKFNIRFEIFQVIKVVWVNDVYKQQLTRESEHNTAFFVRFVNMLLNDATYVLDEALTKFPKIHDLEGQIEGFDKEQGSQEDLAKLEEELQSAQNQATSYMQLANESLEMMKLFTKALVSAFTMPEIVSRLASMMNYNLETLVGPKAGQLRVARPEQYKFRPIMLVSDFVTIYLNLGISAAKPSQLFINAVAADGRCYKPESFARAGQLLGTRNMVDPEDLERWRMLQDRFKEAKDTLDQAELDLGDIPAEFEDPIMGDLMTDPVMLPSKHIVDRQTIMQHLLSDPKDPFTRQPMTIDDAVPATELKERIEAWRLERITAAKASAMDTTEG